MKVAQKTYSEERIRRCEYRKRIGGIFYPEIWPDDGGDKVFVVPEDDSIPASKRIDALIMHESSVTAKFVPLSKVCLMLFVTFLN